MFQGDSIVKNEENKVAVVTGAGSGIGLAIAKNLAASGHTVVVVDIDLARANDLVAELQEGGASALAIYADISKRDQTENIILKTLEHYGRIDVLVNNAGIMDGFTPLLDLEQPLLSRVMGVNLEGALWASRAVLASMLEHGRGVIVNIASVGGFSGGRAGVAYTVSKHALIGLTRSVAWQYGPQGVRCVAVCPGATDTGMQPGEVNAAGWARLEPLLAALPRQGAPEDIAALVGFLASDAARAINGAIVTADHGWTVG
jgi:NAD(P)-dependent dehydrogenase (short-subunit alcohol dehydrogenase family)